MRFAGLSRARGPPAAPDACGGSEPAADEAAVPADEAAPPPYRAFVTNEGSGDLSVIAGGTHEVLATIPLGQAPAGHQGRSGRRPPVRRPQRLAAGPAGGRRSRRCRRPTGRPTASASSTSPQERVVTVLNAGTDPEQVAVSADGTRVFVANEDAATGEHRGHRQREILAQLPVGGEPEGVTRSPDGRWVYITSENDSQVTVIDTEALEVAPSSTSAPGRARPTSRPTAPGPTSRPRTGARCRSSTPPTTR